MQAITQLDREVNREGMGTESGAKRGRDFGDSGLGIGGLEVRWGRGGASAEGWSVKSGRGKECMCICAGRCSRSGGLRGPCPRMQDRQVCYGWTAIIT